MYDHTLVYACWQISSTDIRPQIKWAVNLVIADGYITLPQWFGIRELHISVGIHFVL